jgi:hypothetical protein
LNPLALIFFVLYTRLLAANCSDTPPPKATLRISRAPFIPRATRLGSEKLQIPSEVGMVGKRNKNRCGVVRNATNKEG